MDELKEITMARSIRASADGLSIRLFEKGKSYNIPLSLYGYFEEIEAIEKPKPKASLKQK